MPRFIRWFKSLVDKENGAENQNSQTESALQQNGDNNGHSSCVTEIDTADTNDQQSNEEQSSSSSSFEMIEKLSTLQINDGDDVIEIAADVNSTEDLDKSDYYSVEESDNPNSNDGMNFVQITDNKEEITEVAKDSDNLSEDKENVSEDSDDGSEDKENGSEDSDDGSEDKENGSEKSDEEFFNNLFTDKQPHITYESAATDAFPCVDDSDSENNEVNTAKSVKFFIDTNQSVAFAEYNNVQYKIGFLDLTAEQHDLLKLIIETSVELCFEPNNIVLQNNKLCIKRIVEGERTSPKLEQPNSMWFKILNLSRIQFSKFEPFLAKYDGEIYFVGPKLHAEYISLLRRTKKDPGIAIRLREARIFVDSTKQVLDVIEKVSFDKQQNVLVISAKNDSEITLSNGNDSSDVRRYVLSNFDNRLKILEVESTLMNASIDDDCTEIYAEIDFPFTNAETNVQKKPEKQTEKRAQKVVELKAQKSPSIHGSLQNITANKSQALSDEDDTWSQLNCQYNYLEELPLEMMSLKSYPVPKQIKDIVSKSLSSEELAKTDYADMLKRKKTLRTYQRDYINGYKTMIYFEEEEQTRHLEKFNQSDIQITYHMDRQFWFPISPAFSELSNAIEENLIERFILTPKYTDLKLKGEIWGQVLRVKEQKIYIEIFRESINKVHQLGFNKGTYYDIFFKLNRVPYQLQHFALEFIESQELFTRLINNSYYNCKNAMSIVPKAHGTKMPKRPKLNYENTLLSNLNTEQEKAVQNIVCYQDKLPYVLFGPPGTGKTRTLVGAIEQIVRITNEKILVCAMSNAACDEIAERLIDILKEGEMYRFYAKSYKNEKVNYRVRQYSNFGPTGITYPSLEFLYKFRVLVCTLCSAGCLSRARVDKEIWKPDHFDYVIIDEAASALEPIAMVPIAGVCTSLKQIHAKIVVAGDPKQLDAVVMSEKAKSLGYSTSWLEHLCNTDLYSPHTVTGQYNETYITQLVKNYRSHPHILRVSNELYYNNKLEPFAANDITSWYINSKFLPSKHFPIKFLSVQGKCQKSVENSWYNSEEIDEIIKEIKQLLPPYSKKHGLRQITQADIGIVTPYRKQRILLSQKLRRLNFGDIMVGTAEIFQGKEKPVMIVSTVRSNRQLGFVGEPRRLNVVITRAKCLLIIIGDPFTLNLSKDWRHLMKYCYDNSAFVQSKTPFSFK
ncbi:putative helicase mov-10-B.1 isoform X2 [Contarinia nasturtii]|uniref:putative helicase mov-10-B.1 isoform X2 n=1 Tax=Contarinia nasturtii TaxID=265458 RepID=UPI0012D44981|nr:putative helicase mov-10-B.1 isoform X2 [Contarinia nasturtii]